MPRPGSYPVLFSDAIKICDNKWRVYEFYLASCMNIIFNELRQQRVKYDVHTRSKIKHTHHFLSHIIFLVNLSVILIGNGLELAYSNILIGCS